MHTRDVKEMVDNAIKRAKQQYGHDHHSAHMEFGGMSKEMIMAIIFVVVGGISFIMLRKNAPNIVTTVDNIGMRQFDTIKGIIVAAIIGLIAIGIYHFVSHKH